jgi:GH25 family lysozyme M1 (1,4-beta-N-acetylmuramidase)
MSRVGLDLSHWNLVTSWEKMKESGVEWVYIKFSQGSGYLDPKAIEHYNNAKRVGLLVGAYHFVTKDNAISQYDQFIKCMGNLKFELTPMLDCEAYTSHTEKYTINNNGELIENEVFPVKEFRYGNVDEKAVLQLGEILGYSYPTESIVDVMGMRLAGFQGFPQPAIYTNASSGNVIFKSASMKKYPLYIANWRVTKPLHPAVWKNEPYYIWQDDVVDGTIYGVEDKVDHNIWGTKIEFPGTTPPPPPTGRKVFAKAIIDGEVYSGELKKEG